MMEVKRTCDLSPRKTPKKLSFEVFELERDMICHFGPEVVFRGPL